MSKILSKLSIIQQVDKMIEASFCLLFTGPSRLSSDQYLGYIIQLIVTTKVFLLASFWKWEFLELGNDQSKPHQDKILQENTFFNFSECPANSGWLSSMQIGNLFPKTQQRSFSQWFDLQRTLGIHVYSNFVKPSFPIS